MPTQTNILPGPELMHTLMHRLHPRGILIEPPFRPIDIHIPPKHFGVAVHDPRVHADDRAGGDEVAGNHGAAGGDDAFVHDGEGRVHAEGFVDDGLEVREGAGVGEADVGVGVAGQVGVDFRAEGGVDGGVFEEEVEEGGHCDAPVL